MIGITVKGGTNAGWKIQKPAPKDWVHLCNGARRDLKAYWTVCPDCGTARPKG